MAELATATITAAHFSLKRERYQYRTGTEGPVIEVAVYYSLGGPNYFRGGTSPRGIYASITPITLEDGCVSFVMGSGRGIFVEELARKNDKKLAKIAAKLDAAAPEAAKLFEAGDEAGALSLLKESL